MVKALKANIKRVDLGSKMRQDVWQKEIEKCVSPILAHRYSRANPKRLVLAC